MATTVYGNQVTIASGVKTRLKYVYNTSSTGDSYTISGTLYYGDSSVDGGSEYVSRNFSSAGYFEDGVRVWTQGTYVASDTVSFAFSKSQSAQSHTGRMSAFWRYANSNDTVNSAIDVTVSVPAITTYTVSYNANGGTGAPSAQTKTYGVTLKLSSATPTYSGYTFMGWATSSSNASAGTVSYAAGANYTANQNANLYAVWKRTVTYNANGGSGAPSAQTGYKGSSTTLSSTIPTQTGFTFLGWNTSSNGSGTHYSPGVTYSGISTTLYAMWRRITLSVVSGTARRNGTTCSFSAKWVCQSTVGGTVSSSALYSDTDSIPSKNLTLTGNTTGTKVAGTNLSGTVSGSFTCPENTVGRALVTVTFTDTYSTAYSGTHVATAQLSVTVPKAFRLLTAKHGASWTDGDGDTYSEGLAIGLLASLIGRLEVGLTTLFRKAVTMDKSLSVGGSITAGSKISTDTSAIVVKDTQFDRDGANPSESVWSAIHGFQDKDGENLGYMQAYQTPAGYTGLSLYAIAEDANGNTFGNYIRLSVDKSGTKSYTVSDAAAFRTAINAQVAGNYVTRNVDNAWINNSGGSAQLWNVGAVVKNGNNSTYLGHSTSLIVQNGGVSLYDGTTSTWVWDAYTTLNKPTPAAIGAQPAGSYATTNTSGAINTLASTSTQQWRVQATVNNSSNTDRNGHTTWLVMNNGGTSCWDATASETIWQALTNQQGLSSATGTANTQLNALTWRWFTIGGMRIAFAHGTTKTLAVSTAIGSMYYQNGGITVPIPSSVGFTAAPYGVLCQMDNLISCGPSGKSSWTKTQVKVDAWSATSRASSGYVIDFVVWGV